MRLLVLFLVAFNVTIYAWFSFKSHKGEQEKSSQVQYDVLRVKPLIMKSELDASMLTSMHEQQVGTTQDREQVLEDMLDVSLSTEMSEGFDGDCFLLGPYQEIVTARSHVNLLEKRVIRAEMVESVSELPALYWVFIPPFSTEAEAVSALRRLQENSKDSYLVTEGEFENAISLGVFRVVSSAEMIRKEIVRLGFDAKMTLRKKEMKAIWLSIGEEEEGELTHNLFERMKVDNILLKKQDKLCDDVALLKRIL